MADYDTAQNIVNGTAVEVGLDPVTDIFVTSDRAFRQLRYLLNAAGKELLRMALWRDLIREHSITTDAADSGTYDLPSDFAYMIPQTHWSRTDDLPWYGPLSPQDWQYIEGRGLSSQTIYASFRLRERKIRVYPNDPVPDAKTLVFEYVANTWVEGQESFEAGDGSDYKTEIEETSDYVLYPPILMQKMLKMKFLEAKGFDSARAREDFNEIFDTTLGQDKSAPIINAGGRSQLFPYIDGWRNVPDTGFGG